MDKKLLVMGLGLVISFGLNVYALVRINQQSDKHLALAVWSADHVDEVMSRLDEIDSSLKDLTDSAPSSESPLSRLLEEQARESRIQAAEDRAESAVNMAEDLGSKFNDLCIRTDGKLCL
jgi:hypothetical protein